MYEELISRLRAFDFAWTQDAADALQGQADEIGRLRAALAAIVEDGDTHGCLDAGPTMHAMARFALRGAHF